MAESGADPDDVCRVQTLRLRETFATMSEATMEDVSQASKAVDPQSAGVTVAVINSIRLGKTTCAPQPVIQLLHAALALLQAQREVWSPADIAKHNEDWINRVEQAPEEFAQHAEEVAILFADMVGSTAYKYGRSDIEGIRKSYRHNRMAQVAIEDPAFDGTVVKFIGDGVMGCFRGEDAAIRAVRAGLRLIETLVAYNSRLPEHDWPKKIDTKIGVNSGLVWMMKFRQSKVDDPQGQAVDFAARLQDAAPPMHIAMTAEVFNKIGGTTLCPSPLHSGPHNYALKGIQGLQGLYTVTPQPCCRATRPVLVGAPVMPNEELAGLLGHARKLWTKAEYPRAEEAFQAVVAKDERNFEASYRLAQILVVHPEDGDGTPDDRLSQYERRLEEAVRKLSAAKAVRPHSVALWTLVSFVQFAYCILHKNRNDEQHAKTRLEAAIRDAEHALAVAEGHMDEHGAALAKIYLVVYYNTWIYWGWEAGSYLLQAQRLLPEAEAKLGVKRLPTEQDAVEAEHLEPWMRSNLILGRAMTMINAHAPNRGMIRKLLAQAVFACPDNRFAISLMAEL